jgi:DNA-binding beta-propeller fold protein YncE
MQTNHSKIKILILSALMILMGHSFSAQAAVRGSFLYGLSSFTGTIPYNWSRVVADKERNEIYVLYQNTVRVFNESGMEIFRFGDDLDLGHIVDVAVDKNGDILLLAYKQSEGQPVGEIIHCNYRGEPKSRIDLKNIPSQFSKFSPNRMVYQDGNIYLASLMGLNIIVADHQGNFKIGYDLFSLLELEEKDRGNVEILGFSVDREGNILFTVPTLFKACILSPDGKLNWFGKPGSASGRFNIISGIARDSKGNYLVVDKLKCAVMVFDQNFKFISQFSERGYKPGYLIAPDDIAIDKNDRIYVTQAARRGVSVFKLTYN